MEDEIEPRKNGHAQSCRCLWCKEADSLAALNTQNPPDAKKVVSKCLEALADIRAICGTDLQTHFGFKLAMKIRKAITKAQQFLDGS